MTPLTRSRAAGAAATAVAFVLLLGASRAWTASLHSPAPLTGWVLFALVVLLALYGARKSLPFLPLGSATRWMNVHSWAGVLGGGVFLLHAGPQPPAGVLEALVWLCFVLVFASGIAGLAAARMLPPILRARGESILFARIPAIRREVAAKATTLVASSSALADHHRLYLAAWFAAPAESLAHVRGSRLPLQRRLERTEALFRYLTAEEQATARQLIDLVKQKDLLDAHHAIQSVLRAWTFVHVPLTGALLLLALAHGVTATVFRGAWL